MLNRLLRWIAALNGEPETEQPEEPYNPHCPEWADKQEAARLKARALWEQS